MKSETLAYCFTADEIRVIRRALTCADWGVSKNVDENDIQKLIDGCAWNDRQANAVINRDLRCKVLWALTMALEKRIGGAQWDHEDYEHERSAMMTLQGITEAEALGLALGPIHRHPPTGRLLSMWLLTAQELSIMQFAGLKALRGNTALENW
jgi:hypothetical protein